MSEQLKKIRIQLDEIDEQLQALMTKRAELAVEVGQIKKHAQSDDFYRPEREAQILRKIIERNQGPLDNQTMSQIFRTLMTGCLALQQKIKVAFLGPEGTFSHMAALKHFGETIDTVPADNIAQVFHAVESKAAQFGIVPIENSTAGVVQETLSSLMNANLQICAETILPIHQYLFRQPTVKGEIKCVYAHQQSLAQCSQWLQENLPYAKKIAVDSNAAAAVLAAENSDAAAIGGVMLADIYPLEKIAERIENNTNNQTRFLIIGQQAVLPSGQDKTTLFITTPQSPGLLMKLLQPFAEHGVNISWIESRPYPYHNWSYLFFLDIDGHQQDESVKQALAHLATQPITVTILGSYPKAL